MEKLQSPQHAMWSCIQAQEIQPSHRPPKCITLAYKSIAHKIAMLVYIAPKYLQELLPSRQHIRTLRSIQKDYMDPSFCRNTLSLTAYPTGFCNFDHTSKHYLILIFQLLLLAC